ncbi:hypothetical protein V494_07274 [Pseudogymnoascus sp. VKM F-4513 (FW-928)]|nr:hypothetical protein V494_07274 [Pseudogymnoascus sp. VKM F-4513 (FW-928)]
MTPPKTPDEVKDPRRILFLAPSNATASAFLKDLTGTAPPPPSEENGTLAGTTHVISLKTTYYTADVPIWIDIINPDGIKKWADAFTKEEAKEVIAALGGYVVLVDRGEGKKGWDEVERVLGEVGRVVSVAEGDEWDGVCLGVLLGADAGDEEGWIEDWELVDGAAKGKNELGEMVGVERVREALEANEWTASVGDDEVDELEEELGLGGVDVEGGFEIGEDDVEGMRRPIFGKDDGEEEESVEGMEALMLKMQAMRDLGADMSEADRKKFAAKAVRDLMKTL